MTEHRDADAAQHTVRAKISAGEAYPVLFLDVADAEDAADPTNFLIDLPAEIFDLYMIARDAMDEAESAVREWCKKNLDRRDRRFQYTSLDRWIDPGW